MPVPIRETPMGQLWLAEGRAEGDRAAIVRSTAALLRKRFGDDPRIAAVAEAMAGLTDDDRAELVLTAASLDELPS